MNKSAKPALREQASEESRLRSEIARLRDELAAEQKRHAITRNELIKRLTMRTSSYERDLGAARRERLGDKRVIIELRQHIRARDTIINDAARGLAALEAAEPDKVRAFEDGKRFAEELCKAEMHVLYDKLRRITDVTLES